MSTINGASVKEQYDQVVFMDKDVTDSKISSKFANESAQSNFALNSIHNSIKIPDSNSLVMLKESTKQQNDQKQIVSF